MRAYFKLFKALADENRLRIMQALEIKPTYIMSWILPKGKITRRHCIMHSLMINLQHQPNMPARKQRVRR